MLVSDLLFDIILFGVLLVASVVDFLFPVLHGVATLFAVGAATYIAAQELGDALTQRRWWTQESLATSLSLSTAGFIYYWWRNQSDLALLVLSIGLMMASLMVTISVIAAIGAAIKDKSPKPLIGLVLTTAGAFALGLLAGVLTLNAALTISLTAIISLILWKVRENINPPVQNAMSQGVLSASAADQPNLTTAGAVTPPAMSREAGSEAMAPRPLAHPSGRWMLVPQRGTLLDRFLPVLVLGALLFMALKGAGLSLLIPSSKASASSNTTNPQRP
ncbi:MAG: hypothetical protein JO316_18395 [Abitibacteriaceae bacterium]|nr:hypothetical protein [Abditibacteriaceae bacterium]